MNLQPVEKLEARVLVDNVTDSFSSIPDNVTHDIAYLRGNGMKELSVADVVTLYNKIIT